MKDAELMITPSEAQQLFEEKVTRLRGEMGQAQRGAQEAFVQRDRALHEVTTLQQERTKLIDEAERATQETRQIRESLAEHRKNVEASLSQQEAKANTAIERAVEIQQILSAQAVLLNQRRAQLIGIKQTVQHALESSVSDLGALLRKAQASLASIPDGEPLTLPKA